MIRRILLCAALLICAAPASLLAGSLNHSPSVHAAAAKHITISLARQRLRAWEGTHVVLSTPVTTGNANLPTPVGHFSIFEKRSPFEFISPWPAGSSYWYPPSWVSFAMEFVGGGYFIHDAPWRSVFGKSSNAGGSPGTNYGGTHGCVNVPLNAMKFLFAWAPLGTPVHVVP
jgi:lipoprotein-anchoring transpeptidase ErfK/SrfK